MQSECALLNESRLLDAFRDGDRDALARVYRLYAPLVTGFLRRRVRSRAAPLDPADLLQETFVRAFDPRARLGYDGRRPYRSYLCTIAHNLLVDALRREPSNREQAEEPADAHEPSALMDEELAALVERFACALPPAAKAVWAVRFESGHPQRRAADLLGMTRIQLRRREARIKEDFATFLRSHGYLTSRRPARHPLAIGRGSEWHAVFP